MGLTPRSRLGTYEILNAIGAGGMGEVYRARDTKLGREVAIKVVLDAFVADRERLIRFEREAKALAALNHPNVATLHGMEESAGRHFLVMELVDGLTLQEVIGAARALQLDRALAIAIQISEALEAAHERGIVHRDLKPANVKVTSDEKVKVLDFGLAKAGSGADPTSAGATTSVANSPTITAMGTQAGVILGTASYMSPEQARGTSGDHRSDIFSFGVVLYEMLTGRQPFRGDTVSDVLASLLARDPDFGALPADLSPRLTDLVKRCLEKHPKKRWQAIGDVRHELEVIAANPRQVMDLSAGASTAQSASATGAPLWRRVLPIAAAAILAAGATAIGFIATRPAPPPALPVARFVIPYPEGQPRGTLRIGLAISPDGRHVAYAAGRDLYIRTLAELEPRKLDRAIVSSAAWTASNLVFSPDSKALAYWDPGEEKIKRVDLAGGVSLPICAAQNPVGISWTGDYLYFSNPGGIRRVPVSGGEPDIIITTVPGTNYSRPQVLDDGRILFAIVPPGDDGVERWTRAKVVLQRPGDNEPTTLVQGASDPRYLSSGYLLYQSGGVIFARRFDPRTGVLGSPTSVIDGVMRGKALVSAGVGWYDVSLTGTLVYLPGPMGALGQEVKMAWFDRQGTPTFLPLEPGPYSHPRVSRDGKRIAFSRVDGRESNVWVYDINGGASARRLTFGAIDGYPIWSSDSQSIIFLSSRGGNSGLHRVRADGSGTPERLTTPPSGATQYPQSVSPDGRILLFKESVRDGKSTLMALSLADGKSAPFGGVSGSIVSGGEFSPDGKWVAYAAREDNSNTLIPFVQPYPATGARYQITSARGGGHSPVWSADEHELFFTPGPGQVLSAVKVTTTPSVAFGPAEPVSRPFTGMPPEYGRMFDVTGPGLRLLGLIAPGAADAPKPAREEFRVVLNWVEELKGRVK